MVPRYGFSIGTALAVTFGLLFLMQLLIASGRGATPGESQSRLVDFVRVVRDTTVETRREKPRKPPEPTEPPDLPQTTTTGPASEGLAVTVTVPSIADGVEVGALGLGVAEGEYQPLFKVMPVYPARAQQHGIQGYAIVEYTVTEAGTTRDIRLVESSSPVFDRSCIEAAAKFRYRPRYVNGEAIEVAGVRNRCSYRLDE